MLTHRLTLLLCAFTFSVLAQDPHRFDKEIDSLKQLSTPTGDNSAVFTGSSSMRLWKGLAQDCKRYDLVNTGFGGSQTSDLLYFLDELVLRHKANTVFIYEGDNDINDGKAPDSIIVTMKKVVSKIHKVTPDAHIYLISAKPSPSRWQFREQYSTFNQLLQKYASTSAKLSYIDVWDVMLDRNKRPISKIFISDSLHMNRKGYRLWKRKICKKPSRL